MSGERFSGASEEDFSFLDDVGEAEVPTEPMTQRGRRVVRTRNRAKKSRRYNKRDYVQVSAVVSREVKARFDLALAREKAETGRGRSQFEVIESLMRFYAEEGDPYEMLEE